MLKSTAAPKLLLATLLILTQLSGTLRANNEFDTITGTITGRVVDATGAAIAGVRVRIINQDTGNARATITDGEGRYRVTFLPLGRYTIEATRQGFAVSKPTREPVKIQLNKVVETVPDIIMAPATLATTTPTTQPPVNTTPSTPIPTPTIPSAPPAPLTTADDATGRVTNNQDATRRFNADERQVGGLPLGGVRTFDDLAFLAPGVFPPPEVKGVVGPGIGPGIGSAGQFSVNGQRARSNNFTVDGSDNNDEDVGVRRQGFVSLVPQSIESTQEFQIVTHLWDAEQGRNTGSQVNAVSRSGGREVHGQIYDFFTHEALNARNFFDYTTDGRSSFPLEALRFESFQNGRPNGVTRVPVRVGIVTPGTSVFTQPNPSNGENPFRRHQGGLAIGVPFSKKYFGPLGKDEPQTFFFGSVERQEIRAQQETHFNVPTVEERGFFNFGASGFLVNIPDLGIEDQRFFPTFLAGDAVFSLFPLPNNPVGPYGRNTYTRVLPADGRGTIFSLKFDHNFRMFGPEVTHQLTGRYNFTNDERQIPAVGGAIYSGLEPRVGTQNLSLFLNSQLSLSLANQLRGSYGRTRLRFGEVRDSSLLDSSFASNEPFLLNATRLANFTDPLDLPDYVDFRLAPNLPASQLGRVFKPTEDALGPVGQLIVAPYSPVGLDPYLFPQARTNNTYQIADTLSYFRGNHTFKVGADIRRSQLNSFLDRNYRPQVIFGGTLDFTGVFDQRFPDAGIPLPNLSRFGPTPGYFRGADLASLGIPTGIFQSLTSGVPDSTIGLRFWQYNFFFNDNWRARPGLTFDYGLRYEYNTVPREVNGRIERTFELAGSAADPGLFVSLLFPDENEVQTPLVDFPNANLVNAYTQTRNALGQIIGGRKTIYDPDRNNFAPHFSFAWDPWVMSPTQGGKTVIRGGFGVYYDVALGSVVSQSRNVFPTFVPVNLDINNLTNLFGAFNPLFYDQNSPENSSGFVRILNPAFLPLAVRRSNGSVVSLTCPGQGQTPVSSIICPDSLNAIGIAPGALQALYGLILNPGATDLPGQLGQRSTGGGIAFTLPERKFRTPYAYHYNLQLERELYGDFLFNVAYVGSRGLKLTRFRTPNGGLNSPTFPVDPLQLAGQTLVPAIASTRQLISENVNFRPNPNLGAYTIFDSSARSIFHSLQTSLTKRFTHGYSMTGAYAYAHAIDDVSDVFDLAGAFSLPQNDRNLRAERGDANFDIRHRFTFSLLSELPGLRRYNLANGATRFFLGGWQMATIVLAQTGQPFTVNSSFDINLDGNLTDRLDTTNGLMIRDDRRVRITRPDTVSYASLLAQVIGAGNSITARDGAVGRNTFRSSGAFKVDFTLMKNFRVREGQDLHFRVEAFNLFNRSHFGIPIRILEAQSFGTSVDTSINARQIQFALKYIF